MADGDRRALSSFGIYDAFPDDSGRPAHVAGQVSQALADNTGSLFVQPPSSRWT